MRLMASYGALLNRAQMSRLCPTAKPIAKSWLHDYRLVFQGPHRKAIANVVPEKGYSVPLVIWIISTRDEAALDKGLIGFYNKRRVEVEVDGDMEEVMIYTRKPRTFGTPTCQYFKIIKQGYDDFNLPLSDLDDALKYSYHQIQYNHQEETDMDKKSTRFVDNQGRIIVPSHIRKALNLAPGTRVSVDLADDGTVRVRAEDERCYLCGKPVQGKHHTAVGDKRICYECAQNIAKAMMK